MTFFEAMQALSEGKKVYNRFLNSSEYYIYKNGRLLRGNDTFLGLASFIENREIEESTDWEVIE